MISVPKFNRRRLFKTFHKRLAAMDRLTSAHRRDSSDSEMMAMEKLYVAASS